MVTVALSVWTTPEDAAGMTAELGLLKTGRAEQDHLVELWTAFMAEMDGNSGVVVGVASVQVLAVNASSALIDAAQLSCPFGADGTVVGVGYRGPCPAHNYCKMCQCTWEFGVATLTNTYGQDLQCGAHAHASMGSINTTVCKNVHCSFNETTSSIQIVHHHAHAGAAGEGGGFAATQLHSEGREHSCKYNLFTDNCSCLCHGEQNELWHSYEHWFCATRNGDEPEGGNGAGGLPMHITYRAAQTSLTSTALHGSDHHAEPVHANETIVCPGAAPAGPAVPTLAPTALPTSYPTQPAPSAPAMVNLTTSVACSLTLGGITVAQFDADPAVRLSVREAVAAQYYVPLAQVSVETVGSVSHSLVDGTRRLRAQQGMHYDGTEHIHPEDPGTVWTGVTDAPTPAPYLIVGVTVVCDAAGCAAAAVHMDDAEQSLALRYSFGLAIKAYLRAK
jgi:hypothetical protein